MYCKYDINPCGGRIPDVGKHKILECKRTIIFISWFVLDLVPEKEKVNPPLANRALLAIIPHSKVASKYPFAIYKTATATLNHMPITKLKSLVLIS